jgi:hypothetical protein
MARGEGLTYGALGVAVEMLGCARACGEGQLVSGPRLSARERGERRCRETTRRAGTLTGGAILLTRLVGTVAN